MKRRKKVITAAVILGICIISGFLIFEFKILPIIEKKAAAESRKDASVLINRAVMRVMRSEEAREGEFIIIERDEGGQIVSLTLNSQKVNLIKSLVVEEIYSEMSEGQNTLSIPAGNLTGIKFLSGRGPRIKIKTLPVRSVLVNTSSVFLESGINQTWHKVLLNIEADFSVMVLSYSINCRIHDSVTIADTVIVGPVPDAYTDINKIEDELLGDVVDFSASSD